MRISKSFLQKKVNSAIYFRKDICRCILSLAFVGILGCKEKVEAEKVEILRPNFLVIIADDAGWNDFSYHGSEIQTPSIDSLARYGVQLDRFYVAPTCSPSRAALLTGRPASRMGVVAPISGRSERSLPDSITTLPQALNENGYHTALFGKWHLGLRPSSGPGAYGFDYSYGFLHGQIDQYTHNYKNGDPSWYRNGDLIKEEGHTTDLITNQAIDWLEQSALTSENFYMQVAYSAPHFPLQEEERWKEPYEGVFADSSRRDYAAAMAHMDHSIGQLLTVLKEKGLEESTIVVFMSDNGAMENWYPTDQYDGKFDPNPVLGSNHPLRDWKTSNYEGGIRVPAILSWGSRFSGEIDQRYISVIDLMPTFLKLAGAKNPSGVEGLNIWAEEENNLKDREIYVRGHLQESLIRKPWKLIRTRFLSKAAEIELYNLDEDPQEKLNVVGEYPEIRNSMEDSLELHFSKDAQEVNVGLKK